MYSYYAVYEITEIIKLFLAVYFFSDIKVRNNLRTYILIPIAAAVFVPIFTIFGNNILLYSIFLLIISFIIFKDKVYKVLLMTLWALTAVGSLDYFSGIITRYFMNINNELLICVVLSLITICILWVMGILLRKIYKNKVQIPIWCYVVFIILVNVDGILLLEYENGLSNQHMKPTAYVMIIISVVGYLFEIFAVMILAAIGRAYKEKDIMNQKFLKMQEQQYMYLEEREQDTRRFRHDVRKHMIAIRHLINSSQYEELKKYLDDIEQAVEPHSLLKVNNSVAEAVINQYRMFAEKEGGILNVSGRFPTDVHISSFTICTILSNILQNAVENLNRVEDKNINLKIGCADDTINICETNMSSCSYDIQENIIATSKKDQLNHGYGLANIRNAVRSNRGMMTVEVKDSIFTINVILRNVRDENDSSD